MGCVERARPAQDLELTFTAPHTHLNRSEGDLVIRSQRLRLSRGGFPSVFARLFGTMALAAIALAVVLVGSASAAGPTYRNGFEIDTAGWLNAFGGTITREASGFTNPGGYASAVPSAAGGFHEPEWTEQSALRSPEAGPNRALLRPAHAVGWLQQQMARRRLHDAA